MQLTWERCDEAQPSLLDINVRGTLDQLAH
jgi:hypothetical protein